MSRMSDAPLAGCIGFDVALNVLHTGVTKSRVGSSDNDSVSSQLE